MEKTDIFPSNALTHPLAMVIPAHHAHSTVFAVMRSPRLLHFADSTRPRFAQVSVPLIAGRVAIKTHTVYTCDENSGIRTCGEYQAQAQQSHHQHTRDQDGGALRMIVSEEPITCPEHQEVSPQHDSPMWSQNPLEVSDFAQRNHIAPSHLLMLRSHCSHQRRIFGIEAPLALWVVRALLY